MAIELEKLLSAVSEEAPCGEDLSYDPLYMELERLAAGKPEQQVGDTIVPAEEPDWKELRSRCLELTTRTKDLRVLMHLCMALLKLEGHEGFRDGLALLRGTLEEFWDKVYPQLDPEDNYDPLLRMNIISALTDQMTFRKAVREAPLVRSAALGRFSLRHLEMASGEGPPPADPNTPVPDLKVIEAAFQEVPVESLTATADAIEQSVQTVKGIDEFLTATVGRERAIDFSELEKVLKQAQTALRKYLAKRGVGVVQEAAAGPAAAAAVAAGVSGGGVGEIRSPQDVIRVIDVICAYYERNEPSSPVPLLLKRAQRLVSRSFMDIIQELAPDTVSAMQALGGIKPQ